MPRAFGISSQPRPHRLPRTALAAFAGACFVGVGLAGGALVATGCASDAPRPVRPEYDLRDPSATRRLEAVSTVEKTGDRSQVPVLIELLDDDDESVRMGAGSALKTLTGHDTGYRAYGTPEERRQQVVRWRAWWASSNRGNSPVPIAPPGGGAEYTSGGAHVRAP